MPTTSEKSAQPKNVPEMPAASEKATASELDDPVFQENGLVSAEMVPESIVALMNRNATKSPLLRLPAEIRMIIFGYALTGIMAWNRARNHDGRIVPVTIDTRKYFNSLCHVCRLFQSESFHLELTLQNPYRMHGYIFKAMHMRNHVALRGFKSSLTIFGDLKLHHNPDQILLHDRIINFALQHPNATVRVNLFNLQFKTGRNIKTAMGLAWAVMKAIRGVKPVPYSGREDTVAHWSRRTDWKLLNAKNLRFFPKDRVFDEDNFLRLCTQYQKRFLNHTVLPYFNNDFEAVVEWVRSWYKKGI